MNTRIRELAREAGLGVDYLINTKQICLIDKFAELIVQECADVLDKEIAPTAHPMNSIGYKLKEHFEIQE